MPDVTPSARARGAYLREHLRLPGHGPELPLFAFVFLVALGIDYNIFLMARIREEALVYGTRDGTIRGLAVPSPMARADGRSRIMMRDDPGGLTA